MERQAVCMHVATTLLVAAAFLLSAAPVSGEHTSTGGVAFGLNSFLGNLRHCEIRGPLVKPTPVDRTHYLDAVRDLGVKSIRETFMNWAEIEPERGQGYELEPFDDIAKKASERGIEIIALAYPFPTWATGQAPTPLDQVFTPMWHLPKREFEQEFRAFVSAIVRRYCGKHPESLALETPIRHWIFTNELDAFGVHADEYAFWQKVFWEEVKQADPEAKVVSMGFCNLPGTAFLDALLKSEELRGPDFPYFDILTFHIYPGLNAENVYAMNASAGNLRRSLTAHGVDVPLWLDETGDRSLDGAAQASQAVKLLIHGASTGVCRVNLHGLWDIGENDHWGVLENTPSGQVPVRKPSFAAFQTFLAKVGSNQGVVFLGPGRYLALLPEGKSVYVLWAEGPNTEVGGLMRGPVRVTTVRQEETTMDATDLKLTAEPVFVELLK